MPALDRNFRDVTIDLMPHRSMAVIIDSRPAVKLRLTGTFPAIERPMFASAPPTVAGRSNPTFDSPGRRRRAQRESRRAPTRALPKVSGFVVASAMANDPQWRLA